MELKDLSTIAGFIVTACGFLWFILNITLKNHYTKREVDNMINDALAKFVPETTCLINHRNNDVIVHEIKETVAKIFDKIDELTKAVIRLDYRNREEI